jgi:hypothetical protein
MKRQTKVLLWLALIPTLLLCLTGVPEAHAAVTNSNLWWDGVGAYNCGNNSSCSFLLSDITWSANSSHGVPKPVSAVPDNDGPHTCDKYWVVFTDEGPSGGNEYVFYTIDASANPPSSYCDVGWRLAWGAPS